MLKYSGICLVVAMGCTGASLETKPIKTLEPAQKATADAFWVTPYDPQGSPMPANGEHKPGMECMVCHTDFAFAGTVYKGDGEAPAPHVQVGIRDGSRIYEVYSATNGNFWLKTPSDIDWERAEVRMRIGTGEIVKRSASTPSCNGCHRETNRLYAP